MTAEAPPTTIAEDGSFTAPFELSYPYSRTVGPTLSRFLTGLQDKRIEGTVGDDGRVFVPPAEFDPNTGVACTQWRTVEATGTVQTWSWQAEPAEQHRTETPFAWALVLLDGADVALLHKVLVTSPAHIATGMRVEVVWAAERHGSILDIAGFSPIDHPRADTTASTTADTSL